MADDADVQDGEITLDDFNSDEQDTAKAESSPAEDKKPEAAKDVKEAKAEEPTPPDVPTKTETEDPKVEETETEDKPQGKAEERKAQLNTEIRDLVSQRNSLRDEVEKINSEVYQPATEDELVDQGMTNLEAKVEAMRQQNEMEKYNSRVADAQLTIGSEAERVLNDFPTFNPDSPDYDKDLASEAADLLQSNLILDPNTQQVIGSNVSPYKLYQTLARASGISAAKGQVKGQQATEKQLANVDSAGSAGPPKKPSDPLMDLWTSDD